MIKNINYKMTTNSQLSTTEPINTKREQLEQELESQKWRSHEGLLTWSGWVETGGKGTGTKKHQW